MNNRSKSKRAVVVLPSRTHTSRGPFIHTTDTTENAPQELTSKRTKNQDLNYNAKACQHVAAGGCQWKKASTNTLRCGLPWPSWRMRKDASKMGVECANSATKQC
jgi:hypothetical protein